MDVLADLLQRAQARGGVFAHSTAHGRWGLRFPDITALAFHAVTEGELFLSSAQQPEPVRLLPGDIALVRGPGESVLRSAPDVVPRVLADVAADWAVPGDPRRFRGPLGPEAGPPTTVICGAYRFGGGICDRLLDVLPPLVVLRAGSGGPGLRATVTLLADEVGRDEAGQQAVLDRLLDLVLVQALRAWFRDDEHAPGWYRALQDREVGLALRMLHEEPARAWTVGELADEVGLSRAAFARRFTALLGEPPLAYLTSWRMALARELLRDTSLPLAAIAPQVGYGSEFAFAAAFKRASGTPPARWRAQARRVDVAA